MRKIFTKTIMLFIALAIISGNLTAQATKSSDIKFKSPNNSSKELWDVLYYFDYTEVTSHSGFYAPFYWEGDLYISRWNLQLEENELGKIYKFNNNQGVWELENSFIIPEVEGRFNFEGFTSDGEYIYGVNEGAYIYKIDTSDWTITAKIPVANEPLCIAYDPDKNGFWTAAFIDDVATFVNMDGTATGETLTFNDEDIYIAGLAYDNVTEGGPYLWTSSITDLHRWKVETEEFEPYFHSLMDVPGILEDNYNTNIYIYTDIETNRLVFLGLNEEALLVYAYDFDSPTIIPSPTDFTLTLTGCDLNISWGVPAGVENPKFNLYKENVKVLNETTETSYNYEVDGIYRWCVETVVEDNKSARVCETNSSCVGIDTDIADQIMIYPNPATDKVTISAQNIIKVEIYNSVGQMVYTKKDNIAAVDVNGFESGLYNILIHSGDNKIYSKQIVIAK